MSPIRPQTTFQKLVKHPLAKFLATATVVGGSIAPFAPIAHSATTNGLQQDTVEISTKGQLAQATRQQLKNPREYLRALQKEQEANRQRQAAARLREVKRLQAERIRAQERAKLREHQRTHTRNNAIGY